ncbi:MAG: DUF1838 domain-containing protein [Myxacorys chilensis ATA2-1-KO14]|jgi:hypothetical protein|nr:DUF1838 domain-containing protein [Myxacorys chilensis ATA2-1-KO14]
MTVSTQLLDAQYWVKVRSSLDPSRSTFLVWTGSIYAFVPGEKRKRLFDMVGMSVSRCLATEENSWTFTSRELTYYLDPKTGEKLHTWKNPWTEEVLPVMHVANNPVQGDFEGQFPAQVDDETTTFVFDIFPAYPNPLTDPKFAEYSSNPDYQAAELFKFVVPTADLFNVNLPSVSKLWLSWDRIGPWVPWMKMGNRAGHLIYSASGNKVNDFDQLPPLLQDEINTRMQLYRHAPAAPLDDEDMTSWLYFQKHFDAYLAGETFPIAAPVD